MTGLFAAGAVLALIGLAVMSGFAATLVELAGVALVIAGIVAGAAGGSLIVLGKGLIMAGMTVTVTGLVTTFAMDLWVIRWPWANAPGGGVSADRGDPRGRVMAPVQACGRGGSTCAGQVSSAALGS